MWRTCWSKAADTPQSPAAALVRMGTEKAMKEYTPSEKSTEELREYIAKLTEESEHMTEWPDVDIVVNDEVGQLDRPADAAFFAEGERYLRGTLGDAAYNRIMSEPDDTPEDDTPPK